MSGFSRGVSWECVELAQPPYNQMSGAQKVPDVMRWKEWKQRGGAGGDISGPVVETVIDKKQQTEAGGRQCSSRGRQGAAWERLRDAWHRGYLSARRELSSGEIACQLIYQLAARVQLSALSGLSG
ncbi:unnamed protein product [Pleuronectes platessa]|uniref:Uncharacterized protein n=1 Tax=Pleuronectes platessa TaxID=8262 RepID=A0A9N7W343_PLEPL|nr:unnamed protein product [Pleuronectes platessa]